MSTVAEVFLGIIAFGTLVTGLFYLALIVAGFRVMKRLNDVMDKAERAIQPTVARIDALADRASSVVARASTQIHRAESMLDEVEHQASRVSSTFQTVAGLPKRETNALAAAARAALKGFTARLFGSNEHDGFSNRPPSHAERVNARL
jgi:uncharacterized protein YoxC